MRLSAKAVAWIPAAAFVGCTLFDGASATDDPSDAALPMRDGGADDGSVAQPDDDGGSMPDADAAPKPLLSPSYVDVDVNHVIVAGQSNAVANGGDPPISSTQPFGNLMFDTGVMPMTTCDGDGCNTYQTPTSLVPLVEGDKYFEYAVETVGAGVANEISHLAKEVYLFGTKPEHPKKHDVLVTNDGRSGNTYKCLRKTYCDYNIARGHSSPFGQGVMDITNAKALAAPKTHAVRAVVAIHGESDHYAYVAGTSEFPMDGTDGTPGKIKDYADALVEWQADYEAAAKAITKQSMGVPLLISTVSGWTTTRDSKIPVMQLAAHVRAPGKVILVGPSYPFDVRQDCLHYSNHGYRRLGEYFAKVYTRVIFGGETWEPVRPASVTRAGAVITVKYFVPKPPLVFDTKAVTAADNMGFDVTDDGNLVAISKVEIAGADTVAITLAAAPAGAVRLKYALNQPAQGGCIGNGLAYAGGARGNLHDSDDAPSFHTDDKNQPYKLWNWGVPFDVAVP